MNTDARSAILQRIGSALGRTASSLSTAAASLDAISRNYDRIARLSSQEKLALLEDRLRDYDAEVDTRPENEISSAISAILFERGDPEMVLAPGFPSRWIPPDRRIREDNGLTPTELDSFHGVITTATMAIAETGSLVLQSVPGQGRRALTLVPDFHLCVVRVQDVVENVPEAFARLEPSSTLPTTFISGPSATADIEMTRIKGVHGPRFLHVLLATPSS